MWAWRTARRQIARRGCVEGRSTKERRSMQVNSITLWDWRAKSNPLTTDAALHPSAGQGADDETAEVAACAKARHLHHLPMGHPPAVSRHFARAGGVTPPAERWSRPRRRGARQRPDREAPPDLRSGRCRRLHRGAIHDPGPTTGSPPPHRAASRKDAPAPRPHPGTGHRPMEPTIDHGKVAARRAPNHRRHISRPTHPEALAFRIHAHEATARRSRRTTTGDHAGAIPPSTQPREARAVTRQVRA